MTAPVTVGVCTRDRPESLARCLRSLSAAADLVASVVVVDDGSVVPVEALVRRALGGDGGGLPVVYHRRDAGEGVAAGRNTVARMARTPYVLNLDDDTRLLDGDALGEAVDVMDRDSSVGAVAFARAADDGFPWPEALQPGPGEHAVVVAAYLGFAHLLRRDLFLRLGGYRAELRVAGAEKEFCLRLLDSGYRVVYLPHARVAHLSDPAGRDVRRHLHHTVRGDVLASLWNDPLPVAAARVPLRLARWFPLRKGWNVDAPGGFRRLLAEVARAAPAALRSRTPVRWATLRRWRELRRSPRPYLGPGETL